MLKRDKTGRFSKQSVKKKHAKKVKKQAAEYGSKMKAGELPKKWNPPKVQKAASKKRVMSIDDLTFYDLKDMISAEVALQMRY